MIGKNNYVLSTELFLKDATCQDEKQASESQTLGVFLPLKKYYKYNTSWLQIYEVGFSCIFKFSLEKNITSC